MLSDLRRRCPISTLPPRHMNLFLQRGIDVCSFSSRRVVPDRAANMCVKVSRGFLCRAAERCVWGLPSRLFAVCGRSALHPLPEHSEGSAVPAGGTLCPTVCQVRGQSYFYRIWRVHAHKDPVMLQLYPESDYCPLEKLKEFNPGGKILLKSHVWCPFDEPKKKKKAAIILTYPSWCLCAIK